LRGELLQSLQSRVVEPEVNIWPFQNLWLPTPSFPKFPTTDSLNIKGMKFSC